jgi:hypothetical protein
MDFYDVLDQVVALLQRRRRVTYRALKLQFKLDDETLEALKDELLKAQRLAVDEAGEVLVWVGDTATQVRQGIASFQATGGVTTYSHRSTTGSLRDATLRTCKRLEPCSTNCRRGHGQVQAAPGPGRRFAIREGARPRNMPKQPACSVVHLNGQDSVRYALCHSPGDRDTGLFLV